MHARLPPSWSRDNALERREQSRRPVTRWLMWAVGVLLALLHAGVPAIVGIEVTEHPNAEGFLVGLGSMLAIFGSHVFSLAIGLLLLPPLAATCFLDDLSSGAADSLCLAPVPRPTVLLAKLRPRLEPLFWATAAQAVFVTVAVVVFEVWWRAKRPDDSVPPLGAIASLLWSLAALAAPAAASLWAGMRFRSVGKSVAVAYLASWTGLSLGGGLAVAVGALLESKVLGPIPDRVMVLGILGALCASGASLLGASGWLLHRCITQFDDLLAGSAD